MAQFVVVRRHEGIVQLDTLKRLPDNAYLQGFEIDGGSGMAKGGQLASWFAGKLAR